MEQGCKGFLRKSPLVPRLLVVPVIVNTLISDDDGIPLAKIMSLQTIRNQIPLFIAGRGRVRQDPGPEAEGGQGGQGTEEEEVCFPQGEQELCQIHLDPCKLRIIARLLAKGMNILKMVKT